MSNVQQIKTSVRGYNLLPGRPQFLTMTREFLKLDDFSAHFVPDLRLYLNWSWSFTDLRDGLSRMAKRETKHNGGRLQHRRGFKICKDPTERVAEKEQLSYHGDRMGLARAGGPPVLFAIARDSCTIFASWTIDWRSVFENGMPADRQIHLQLLGKNGVIERRFAVEPMSMMHYLTISGWHDSYRVEIGYFQPFETWHSVATSSKIEMPTHGSFGVGDADLVTIPFHLSFHQLASLFGVANDASVARVVSAFQKRVLSNDNPNEATPCDMQIVRDLNVSLPEIAAAEADFKKIDTKRLARRARTLLGASSSSPASGFQARWMLAGS
jgi:hypothetical protein